MRTKNFLLFVMIVVTALIVAGCGRRSSKAGNSIQVKGSNTMLQLGQAWAEAYNAISSTKVSVSGEGSGVGISALINGTTDIAEASREMEPAEIKDAKAKGIDPIRTTVAWDGLAIIVNPSNPVRKLTIEQLRSIFLGEVKNWREVGGPNEEIVVTTRDTSSGTHQYFKEKVLRRGNSKGKEEFPRSALTITSSQTAVQTVEQDKGAIAYVGLGYVTPKVADVAIAKSNERPYIKPTIETVMNRSYPISRALYFYTNGQPTGKVKAFVDFVLSDKGQQIVEKIDFVPIRKVEAR
ncbi:MAG: PstS family phosphate ABC transporter substrate-binding protein [Armatimonadota bacterium]